MRNDQLHAEHFRFFIVRRADKISFIMLESQAASLRMTEKVMRLGI